MRFSRFVLIIFFGKSVFAGKSVLDASALGVYITILLDGMLNDLGHFENTTCRRQMEYLLSGVFSKKNWALKMIDSWAKPQTGLMSGNVMHFGNYDECLALPLNPDKTGIIPKYCTLLVEPKNFDLTQQNISGNNEQFEMPIYFDHLGKARMSFGVCLPLSCGAKEIQEVTNFLNTYFFDFDVDYKSNYCDYRDKQDEPKLKDVLGAGIFCIFAVLVLISTIVDAFIALRKIPSKYIFYTYFSFYTNWKNLFNPKTEQNHISCLDGIRVIMMMWLILVQSFVMSLLGPNVNSLDIYYQARGNILNATIVSGTFIADTFLTVSGLLTVYIFLHSLENGNKFNILKFYFNRFVRLIPSLFMVIILYTTIFNYFAQGPMWTPMVEHFTTPCKKNWFWTLLFVQNYAVPNDQCVSQGWYLAIDTQLYILSPLILVPILRWPKRTIFAVTLLVIASAIDGFITSWIFELDSLFMQASEEFNTKLFYATHMRVGPWLMGSILGYVIFSSRQKKIEVNKNISLLLWILSFLVMATIIFGHVGFTDYPYNRYRSSFFNSLARDAWALAIVWIIFACVKNPSNPVNKFLSSRIFKILVRFNYSMFLLHVLVLFYKLARRRTPDYFDSFTQFNNFWGNYVFTLFVSVIWTMIFELPFIRITKYFLPKKVKNHNVNSSPDVLA